MANPAIELLLRVGGVSLVHEVTEAFLASVPSRLDAIGEGLVGRDAGAIERAAHALKGSSGQVGADAMGGLCGEIERDAARGAFESIRPHFAELGLAFEEFRKRLAADVGALAPERARRRIAVVEDNDDNRLLFSAILRRAYELDEYRTGLDALDGLHHRAPDLILLDISLPQLDGLEVLARVRGHPSLRRLPVIAVTAHAMAGDRERYLAAGFDEYVSKPIIDERALLEPVERLLAHHGNGVAAA